MKQIYEKILTIGIILQSKQVIELDYSIDLHGCYQNLSHLPGFVLLESADRQHGRYDILSAYPYERLLIPADAANLSDGINYLREKLSPHNSSLHLPFQGGAIGYFSYDLGAKLLGINSTSYSLLNDLPLLNLGFYDWGICVDHQLKKVFLYAENQNIQSQERLLEVIDLWKKKPCYKEFKLTRNFKPLMLKEDYESSFLSIKEALKQGRCYQANFTQAFEAQYIGDSWAMYHQICKQNKVPFAAYLHLDNEDILSFSPERFLLQEKGTLLSSPIKGTMKRSNDPIEDEQLKSELIACAKNRAEHVMIVDLLRNDLGKIAQPGSVCVEQLFEIQSYKSIHHLVSDIKAQYLPEIPLIDLFLSCFPGGSITGAPKLESMRIINELEPYGRGIYCGSIAYFSRHGRFDSNIAIRTLMAKNNYLYLAAGGGLVIDSVCEDEYRECYIKINAILNGLK